MMNKQEVIERLEEKKSSFNSWEHLVRNRAFDDALDIVKQIDEPEKTVVPRCVADFITNEQRSCSTLSEAIDNMDMRDEGEVTNWFYDNSETFAKAWIYGYEIKKEKLYTVEIPNPGSPLHFVLCKYGEGEVRITYYNSDNWRDYKCVQLTESEIKQDFEWAWKFRKEVEE